MAKTKWYYLDDAIGITREDLLAELEAHEEDDYYIGTPYKDGGDYRNSNGDPEHKYGSEDKKGKPAFNCTGFVWRVLYEAGAKAKYIPAMTDCTNCWENPKRKGHNSWWRFIKGDAGFKPEYYYFDTVDELLNSGKAEKGDIIYMLQTGAVSKKSGIADSHVGIFWGDTPSENKFFHSGPTTKYGAEYDTGITKINACSPSYYYLLKWKSDIEPGWEKEDGYWYYYSASRPICGKWLRLKDIWYHFDKEGHMQTGWQKISGKWFLFSDEGSMVTGWKKKGGNWYYLDEEEGMLTGWQKLSGSWYHFTRSGVMDTGWVQLNNKWFFLNKKSGVMQTGWKKAGSTWYYLNENGVMQTGWQKLSGNWYYFDKNGIMASGKVKIGKKTYTFAAGGAWVK